LLLNEKTKETSRWRGSHPFRFRFSKRRDDDERMMRGIAVVSRQVSPGGSSVSGLLGAVAVGRLCWKSLINQNKYKRREREEGSF